MKKSLLALLVFGSFSALAAGPQFDNLTKDDVEDVSREFGVNFSHTAVAAPETEGVWGIEVGIVGGQTSTPNFKDVVNASGGDGSDFEKGYHGGAMVRGHFPFDLFAELTYLPETDISDVTVENKSFGAGWNAGEFFGLPLDLAVGVNYATGDISFKQTAPIQSKIDLEMQSTVYWLGVSKRFAFFTPYLKFGSAKIEGDLKSTASILTYTSALEQNVSSTGTYLALGANVQFLFFKLGVETSKTVGVGRTSGKISFDF
jgi:hypothetical protein